MGKLLSLGLFALTKLPMEKLFYRRRDPTKALEKLEAKLLTNDRLSSLKRPPAQAAVAEEEKETPASEQASVARVTNAETIQYQRRELGKVIMLLELHLQQGCKINGKACDCCEKHPIVIEGLAEETLGMTGDKLYEDVIAWAKKITPITTEEASRSGKYDNIYPDLAVEGRNIRKRIMGTADVKALLSPQLSEKVSAQVQEILDRAMKKEGGEDEPRRTGTEETV